MFPQRQWYRNWITCKYARAIGQPIVFAIESNWKWRTLLTFSEQCKSLFKYWPMGNSQKLLCIDYWFLTDKVKQVSNFCWHYSYKCCCREQTSKVNFCPVVLYSMVKGISLYFKANSDGAICAFNFQERWKETNLQFVSKFTRWIRITDKKFGWILLWFLLSPRCEVFCYWHGPFNGSSMQWYKRTTQKLYCLGICVI